MKWKSVGFGVLGGIVAVLGTIHANGLLKAKALAGPEFVWLTAAYLATGLLITVLSKVTELSFSSITLKIAAAERAAEVTLEQLKLALELSFAPTLARVADQPGGFFAADGPKDGRLSSFFVLAEAIEKAGLRNRFAAELSDAARTIAQGQLNVIARYNSEFTLHHPAPESLPTPQTVRVEACKPNGIISASGLNNMDEHEALRTVNEAVDAYAKIYSFTS